MASYATLLTPDAVHAVLSNSGLQAAAVDDYSQRPVTDGFLTCRLPVTHEDRVAVIWHADLYGEHDAHAAAEAWLSRCAAALARAGYQTEFVNELVSDYLVVWIEGEF